MSVRIIDDAERRYAEDARWSGAAEHEKILAVNILAKITGQEFPVIFSERKEEIDTLFYHLLIRPKIQMVDTVMGPQTIGYAFIPADYCERVRSGFWEAR